MSTSSGVTSKGEKGKQKFQSLDIISLIRVSRGEPSEKQQQKSTHQLKHGMQSLGKVPSARRPPANLPSLKSEHSGSDSAVSLVPAGGPGWAKQENTSSSAPAQSTATVSTTTANTTPASSAPQISAHQAAIALPVQNTIPATKHTGATPATGDKSWSSVMTGSDGHPPPYQQSPQFQHEFPSLSAGDGGSTRTAGDIQYGPGPSLRPQTEGSWMQGGSRATNDAQHRNNSAPQGAAPQHSAPAGPGQQKPPQFLRGFIQQYMPAGRGNFAANGHGAQSGPPSLSSSNNSNSNSNARNSRSDARNRNTEDEIILRPIIKEEELSRMDDMTRDMGWATHDDIDYNQKLAFSDDESPPEKDSKKKEVKSAPKEQEKTDSHNFVESENKAWGPRASAAPLPSRRSVEEEEINARRRQQRAEVNIAVERAKQRKEEEEKKYLEVKQNAIKKLQELDERKNKSKRDDPDDSQGTINPSVVPPQPITPAPIPVPDWERDKEKPARNSYDYETEKKPARENAAFDFKQMTQIEGKSFARKDSRSFESERDRNRENGPNFSKQYQNNLPPRFQKQYRNNSNPSPQPQNNAPFSNQYESSRWMQNQMISKTSSPPQGRKREDDRDVDDRRDFRRQGSDDSYRSTGGGRYNSESGRKSADIRFKDEDDFHQMDYISKRDRDENKDKFDKHEKKDGYEPSRFSNDDIDRPGKHYNRREDKIGINDRYERPQRPDSRDSRTSRESKHSRESARDSEPREYVGAWADSYDSVYEEKKKESLHFKEDRRQVPGPITKDRIEQDDLKNEKRSLTQLKRGQIPEKKSEIKDEDKSIEKEVEDVWGLRKKEQDNAVSSKAWADSIPSSDNTTDKYSYGESPPKEQKTDDEARKDLKDKDDKNRHGANRNRSGWNTGPGMTVRNTWGNNPSSKRNWGGRSSRTGPPGSSSVKSGEFHGTDSEISADEMSIPSEIKEDQLRTSQRSPKPSKKYEKEEKNKEVKQDKNVEKTVQEKTGQVNAEKFTQDKSEKEKSSDHAKKDYVPRGEPSRHGRGGGSFRGGRGGLSKRIDGYGPPPSKSPFGHHDDKKHDDNLDFASSDEKSKQQSRKDQNLNQTRKNDDKFDRKSRRGPDSRRGKSKNKEDPCDTASDNSEDSKDGKKKGASNKLTSGPRTSTNQNNNAQRRNNPPPRMGNEKRNYNGPSRNEQNSRQNSSGNLRTNQNKKDGQKDDKDVNFLSNAVSDMSLKNELEIDNIDGETEDKNSAHGDSDGFQEVKSKKNVKERQKADEKPAQKSGKNDKDMKERSKGKGPAAQLSQQQIANIPPLMGTPIPPPVMTQPKNQFINRKLPPRFAKQRENRLQKQHMHNMSDVNDMNKVNQNMNVYGMKEVQNTVPVPIANAWEKPLSVQLRGNIEQEGMLGVGMDNCKGIEQTHSPNQGQNSPNTDKVIGKTSQLQEKAVLDGTTPPVETIIFENTNYKSAPGTRVQGAGKARNKMEENMDNSVMSGFNKPIADLLNKNEKQNDAIRMASLAFNKEDGSDIKLDFMESEISYLTDDKASKNLGMARSMHTMTSSNSTISPSTADSLNMKIASVKKVWETSMPAVLEHNVGQDDGSSFPGSFAADPNSLDPSGAFAKGTDTPEDNNEGYSPSPNQNATNSTSNVCKVKPTQQVTASSGQTALNSGGHQQHNAMVGGPGLMGHPLSPPPMQPVIGAGVGLGQPPQQFTANQHALGYQASLGGSTQYGMPAIPSPPTVLYNSTQPLQAQTGLFAPFQIDQSQVLGNQGRSQYSQYPNHYGLSQTASSPYSQSMYLPTAQPHPPPTAQAPPDMYQSLNNYRLPGTAPPFGQNQQLNNQSTVLISSSSNSLMSATVKPSSQQISAIGTKAGGVGQAYQQQSQQGQQLFMTYDPTMQPNYLQSTGVMQRGPAGPVQNNVVPAMQQSSSYYSAPTGGQTGYFQQPGSSLQSAPLQQHQAGYGLQGNVFGTHNQSHTNFSSHFISSPLQLAAAITQYRSPNLPTTYMKNVANQQLGEQSGRSQQLKSPSSQQEVLSSVFTSGPQIPSPKSRQNCKQPPPQPSPTAQHKYNLYQNVGNQQSGQGRSYPPPIQRPVNFQQTLNSVQSNGNQKHRSNNANRGAPPRQYYSSQGNTLPSQSEKSEDKLSDSATTNTTNSNNATTANSNAKATIGSTPAASSQSQEIPKDKEDSSAMKD